MGTSTGSNDSSESNDKPGENTETSPEADSRTRPDDDGCETSTTTGRTASTTTDGSGTTSCPDCHALVIDLFQHQAWHARNFLGLG